MRNYQNIILMYLQCYYIPIHSYSIYYIYMFSIVYGEWRLRVGWSATAAAAAALFTTPKRSGLYKNNTLVLKRHIISTDVK